MAKKVEQGKHIIDVLMNERASKLLNMPVLKSFLKLFFYPLFGYQKSINIIDAMAEQSSAAAAMDTICADISIRLSVQGDECIPLEGSAIVVSNHPSGIGDGLAMYELLKKKRSDFAFFANRDVVRAIENMRPMIIPVEWRDEEKTRRKTRETASAAIRAVRDKKLIVMFPSGRLAKGKILSDKITERPWNNTAVRLACRYNLPIIPVHIDSRNSKFFYLLGNLSKQIRDLAIFHEIFNKKNALYKIKFAPVIMTERLVGDSTEVTARLREYVSNQFEKPLVLPADQEASPLPLADERGQPQMSTY